MNDSVDTGFAPVSDANWPAELEDLRQGFAGQLNVYRAMAHHPALLRAWSDLREHVVNHTALGPVRAEVVILRAAHRLQAPYERSQHILRARRVGLSDARIAALDGPLGDIGAEDRLLAEAVDNLIANARLPNALLTALVAEVGRKAVLDLMATVGFYSTLGYMLNTAQTPLDEDAEAALTARPLAP
ncbi:MAG: carboxymuconolactone decarboxylase family protein [Arenibacterium sp.]